MLAPTTAQQEKNPGKSWQNTIVVLQNHALGTRMTLHHLYKKIAKMLMTQSKKYNE